MVLLRYDYIESIMLLKVFLPIEKDCNAPAVFIHVESGGSEPISLRD